MSLILPAIGIGAAQILFAGLVTPKASTLLRRLRLRLCRDINIAHDHVPIATAGYDLRYALARPMVRGALVERARIVEGHALAQLLGVFELASVSLMYWPAVKWFSGMCGVFCLSALSGVVWFWASRCKTPPIDSKRMNDAIEQCLGPANSAGPGHMRFETAQEIATREFHAVERVSERLSWLVATLIAISGVVHFLIVK